MNTITFRFISQPKLVDNEERPFATVYLTSDIEAVPRYIECRPEIYRNKEKDEFEIIATFSISNKHKYIADSSVCVQNFCHLLNHKQEQCIHRCGFAAFGLRGLLKNGPKRYVINLRDIGPSKDGRGTVIILLDDNTMQGLSKMDFTDPSPNDFVGQGMNAGTELRKSYEIVKEYHLAGNRALLNRKPTTDEISLSLLPMYVQSAGIINPSCAFLMIKNPPKASEDYYLNCLDVALFRDTHWSRGTNKLRSELISRFCDDKTTCDERGSILIDIAMMLPVSCPYLYDTSISRNKTHLVNSDEFSRLARFVLCEDCEDSSFEACMVLWDILKAVSAGGQWKSHVMNVLQQTRAKYVATVTLKSVTRPSESGPTESLNKKRGYAAHACCDLIPIYELQNMLARDTCGNRNIDTQSSDVLKSIITKRSTLINTGNNPTMIVVGEGTGIVTSYVSLNNVVSHLLRREVKNVAAKTIPIARMVSREYLPNDSGFYKYTVSAIIHDTLFERETETSPWILPQITYHWNEKTQRITRGCPHNAYVKCDPKCAVVTVCPVPHNVWTFASLSEKFEHPVPDIVYPPAKDTIQCVDKVQKILDSALLSVRPSINARTHNGLSSIVTLCISAEEIIKHPILQFLTTMAESDNVINIEYIVKPITTNVSVVVLHITMIDDS